MKKQQNHTINRRKFLEALANELLKGKTDKDTEETQKFPSPVSARYVRIYPQAWHSYMSLRMELLIEKATGPMR